MKSVSYELGDLFAVPLRGGGFGVAIVVRWLSDKRRGAKAVDVFGFGKLYEQHPSLREVAHLTIFDAVHHITCGDRAMSTGRWPRIGQLPRFRLEDWPVPPHCSGDRMDVPISEDEDGSENVSSLKYIAPHERHHFPQFIALGDSAYLEVMLDHIIRVDNADRRLRVTPESVRIWRRVLGDLIRDGIVKKATI